MRLGSWRVIEMVEGAEEYGESAGIEKVRETDGRAVRPDRSARRAEAASCNLGTVNA